MSTTYYLRKPLSVIDIESKTEIRLKHEDNLLVLKDSCISAEISADGNMIDHLKSYYGMGSVKIIQDLASKVGAEIMSEYAIREYLEIDEPIPESAWQKYTASIIATIEKTE